MFNAFVLNTHLQSFGVRICHSSNTNALMPFPVFLDAWNAQQVNSDKTTYFLVSKLKIDITRRLRFPIPISPFGVNSEQEILV
ncbi:hypothetical protein Ahy_A06g030117 isoform A [Arachis hypogaea]|uniref:Uncharacterized protein n=1 Tax=Arachis hypogaea TaxID=3818 RepID=A0A445CVB3_ARAHY|nr:hypothetical protein Ahy_A06g030117 isoform A [Arachis hypogaea]